MLCSSRAGARSPAALLVRACADDGRCLVLRLFEPSDDPAHPRVVDDLLAYRGMQRAFEERSDYRGCRDMEAYCDEYDPDRAYLGAIAEPGAWYDNYVNDYADEEDDHEDDYDFGGA